jgi:hypothetical protein
MIRPLIMVIRLDITRGVTQNFTKNLTYTGKYNLPEILIHQPVKFLTAVTRKSLTIWSRLIDHRKAERVVLQNGIQDF